MGNICGCVRGPKEECYVDPKKAPLKPGSKELKGRRYFQRKKRKSQDFQPGESPRGRGSEPVTSEAICSGEEPRHGPEGIAEVSQEGLDRSPEAKTHLSRQGSLSKGVYVGEVPVIILRDPRDKPLIEGLACRLGKFPPERTVGGGRSRSIEGKLHGIHATSRAARDGLFVKKLLRRQLRRAVSFGAVEHMLRTLRGKDTSGSEDAFAKIIWDSQAHRRRRRRASICSGDVEHLPAPAKCISTPHKVKL